MKGKQSKKKTRMRKLLDIDKLKHKGITKKEYRDHLLELIKMVDEMPFVAIDQAVENITLFHRLVKELYRIDSEGENES